MFRFMRRTLLSRSTTTVLLRFSAITSFYMGDLTNFKVSMMRARIRNYRTCQHGCICRQSFRSEGGRRSFGNESPKGGNQAWVSPPTCARKTSNACMLSFSWTISYINKINLNYVCARIKETLLLSKLVDGNEAFTHFRGLYCIVIWNINTFVSLLVWTSYFRSKTNVLDPSNIRCRVFANVLYCYFVDNYVLEVFKELSHAEIRDWISCETTYISHLIGICNTYCSYIWLSILCKDSFYWVTRLFRTKSIFSFLLFWISFL